MELFLILHNRDCIGTKKVLIWFIALSTGKMVNDGFAIKGFIELCEIHIRAWCDGSSVGSETNAF